MLEVATSQKGWPRLGLESREDMEDVPQHLHKLRRQHLCEGSFSPAASILSQLAMGKKYSSMHVSPANIHWSADEQTIYFQGQGITLAKLRTTCQRLTGELQALLLELAFQKPLPGVQLDRVVDSIAWAREFRQLGHSFVSHPQNASQTGAGYRYLFVRAREAQAAAATTSSASIQTYRLFRKARDGQQTWHEAQKQAYLRAEQQFLRKLMVAVHVSAGQPARGPEIGSIKVSNSLYSARNVYVLNGRVCFLTMYDKSRKRRGNTDYILRFLPDQLSQLLVQYLVYIRPFVQALAQQESAYLFAGPRGPWAGEELSQALSKATSQHLGVRLTLSMWRHVAIGIAVRHLSRASRTWETDQEGEEGEEEAGAAFAEGNDAEELEQDTFRHILVR